MSKRFIITRKNGQLNDWGADSIEFTSTHVLFKDNGEIIGAVHADEVRELVVEDEE